MFEIIWLLQAFQEDSHDFSIDAQHGLKAAPSQVPSITSPYPPIPMHTPINGLVVPLGETTILVSLEKARNHLYDLVSPKPDAINGNQENARACSSSLLSDL